MLGVGFQKHDQAMDLVTLLNSKSMSTPIPIPTLRVTIPALRGQAKPRLQGMVG